MTKWCALLAEHFQNTQGKIVSTHTHTQSLTHTHTHTHTGSEREKERGIHIFVNRSLGTETQINKLTSKLAVEIQTVTDTKYNFNKSSLIQ